LHDWRFVDTIANVPGNCWFTVAGVDDAFISFDVNLYVLFAEIAPVLFDKR
jgi:hypothetical protein